MELNSQPPVLHCSAMGPRPSVPNAHSYEPPATLLYWHMK